MANSHDYSIANDTGSAVRTDLNTLFTEVEATNAGPAAPSNLATGKLWYDTANSLLKQYDGSAWVTIMDSTGGTFTGAVTLPSPVINTGVSGSAILDEDAMGSDSATKLATQQSIKAYVDANSTADQAFTTARVGTATTAAQGVGTGDSPSFAGVGFGSGYAGTKGMQGASVVLTSTSSVTGFSCGDSASGTTLATSTSYAGAIMGTGLTISNEEISFPSSGYWLCIAKVVQGQQSHSYARYAFIEPRYYNGSSWETTGARGYCGNTYNAAFSASYTGTLSATCTAIIPITNSSTNKVKLYISNPWSQLIQGNTSGEYTGATFIRLGDI